jgi:hypothetical protein
VAAGDAISFNTVYRDRDDAWNIQDLPFSLVFFCHRNPIDPQAGFRVEGGERSNTAETGTEDVLLFGDIVESLVQTSDLIGSAPLAEEVVERLLDIRWRDGRIVLDGHSPPLFDREGQRSSGTGEHVVCLKPVWDNDDPNRLLPRATIEVWAWRPADESRGESGQYWQRRGEPLHVAYNQR